jgi:hypothetical protein
VVAPLTLGAEAAAQPRPVGEPLPSESQDVEADAAMAGALERALSERWSEVRVRAECRLDGEMQAVELFGSGVGIWNGEVQIRVERAEIDDHLKAVRESGFAAWPTRFGGKPKEIPVPNQPPRVTCRVEVEVDGARKQVVQFQRGEQSEGLKALAQRLLVAGRERARSGMTAADLNDGLGKVATGVLAPETFSLVVNRRAGTGGGEGENWLLRIDGRQGSSREGPARTVERELDADELSALARVLAEADLPRLPTNLYADQYTDVVVKVLNRRVQVNARRFAGMTADTHGSKQKRFDDLLAQLRALHRRFLEGPSTESKG